MATKHILDRLADAVEQGRGLVLTANDAEDILDEIGELELARELDVAIYERMLAELQGIARKVH
jgi:hypothetical protein